MFYKDTPMPRPVDESSLYEDDTALLPFPGSDYYPSFLQQLGLKEMQDDRGYFLTPAQGRNWTLDFDGVTAAVKQLHIQEKQDTDAILAMLAFVIEKADRTDALPPYILSYICRDLVTRVILQRFNETIGCSCTSLTDLSYKIGDNVAEANETFNTLRFCDPAMGSGRFLIALMNEMIIIKSQLGILADRDDNPLFQYKITVNGDTLTATDKKHFNTVPFTPANPASKRIQETFLHEKQIYIENCLYGVDVNPVSVVICRMRLWYELLKHACRQGKLSSFSSTCTESNLRCGDALISRFPVGEDLHVIFKRIGYNVGDYKMLTRDFRKARTGEERESLAKIIALVKGKIRHEIEWNEKNSEELKKWQRELEKLKSPNLFASKDTDVKKNISVKLQEAQLMVGKYRQKIEETKNNPVYEKAIEWRYEFPELLDDTGSFAGFDAVVGNPPDTQKDTSGESNAYKQANYKAFKHTGEVSSLYYELGNKILRPDYYLSYIAANNWMRSVSAGRMRQFLMEETNPLLMIEFEETNRIGKTLGGKGITVLQKSRNQHRVMACRINEHFDPQQISIDDYLIRHAAMSVINMIGQPSDVTTSFSVLSDTEKSIKNKIEQSGIPLRTWDIQMHAGIKTGYDEAFIIDDKTKDIFVRADYKNGDIIKPLLPPESIKRYTPEKSDRWLICIPWHFPLLYDKSITRASERAEERFAQQYPVIYDHLVQYKDKLVSRNTPEVGVTFEWYALQRLSMNNEWDDFTQQKIVWRQEASTSDFCFDYGGCAVPESNCFIIGQHLKYLLGILNSSFGQYMLKDSPRINSGDMQLSILTLEALRLPVPNAKIESDLISLVNKRTSDTHATECEELEHKIDQLVYEIFGLNKEEIDFIENEINHLLT
jgi:hypothetical protein